MWGKSKRLCCSVKNKPPRRQERQVKGREQPVTIKLSASGFLGAPGALAVQLLRPKKKAA
jgi:hypothetical protein